MNITTQQLFEDARTHSHFKPESISDDTLKRLYELMKWGPTSANSCPARLLFVQSTEAKARLSNCMTQGNVEKTRQAPVTVIIGMDLLFYEKLPTLYPPADAKSWFTDQPALIEITALRNSSLQGAYFILAARALGLDCGPMSGFDAPQVDAEFWSGTSIKTNFICNLGYGIREKLHPRHPRLSFDTVCKIL
jgi:3-hydroxypropanoate dehydrogenase